MTWNKIVKGGLVCLSVYSFADLMYQVGKGRILGMLLSYNLTPEAAKQELALTRNHYPENIILSVCKTTEKELSEKDGAV